ncbi:MAG: FecR domain-containing protein [Sediminibacterium magnilacihabitans]|jgi:transmembrane sensor|nr:FecR domain-containing protein [Sediminibacterium magnilacihabitans]PQV59384.1 FecR family protein [Sediminibacterium magnilacihabitans]
MKKQTFQALLDKYLNGTATAAERRLVEAYYEKLSARQGDLSKADRRLLEKVGRNLSELVQKPSGNKARIIPFYKRRATAAAAAILLLMAATTYFLWNEKPKPVNTIAKISDIQAPVTNRAMITLGNGRTVYLDSAANGSLATEGNVQLIKLADGKIAYSGSSDKVTYHTITNPKGSKVIDLALSDGSHVWLNAESSLTFPIVFNQHSRELTATGEMYFEVEKAKTWPFVVTHGDTKVTVLGTHFNVNAYDDEQDIRVTLLQGAVKISNKTGSGLLKPGEQARVSKNIHITKEVDLDAVMAWKNGRFNFDNASLSTVLRQLARWYDLEVVYEGAIPEREFGGQMQRDLSLSQILEILQKMDVKFRVEGKKLLVTAAQ